jgi:3-hydroxybutyryl-CoA dehydratase
MGFPAPIAHGLLIGAMYSSLLGRDLPGPNSVIMKLALDMVQPVLIGDGIEYSASVSRLTDAMQAVELRLSATNGQGVVVSRGTAVCVLRSP